MLFSMTSLLASSAASGAAPLAELAKLNIQTANIVMTYTDGTINTLPVQLHSPGKLSDGVTAVTVAVKSVNGQTNEYTLSLKPITEKSLKFVDCELLFTPDLTASDVRVFANSDTTNSRVTVRSMADSNGQMSKDVGAWHSAKTGKLLGVALTTVDRFWAYLRYTPNGVKVRFAMEDKPLIKGQSYRLEKFIISAPKQVDELFRTYTDIMAKRYRVKVTDKIPTGWCSWSCAYGNLSKDVAKAALHNLMSEYGQTKPNTLQLDDGWQRGQSFGGYWTPRIDGLNEVASEVKSHDVDFGLWFAPFITSTSSGFFTDYPQYKYVKTNDAAAEYTLTYSNKEDYCYPMAINKPETLEYLKTIFERATKEYGASYFKLDFLLMGLRSAYSNEQLVIYPDDYIVAIYRRALKTIRDAVGKDVYLLACGAPIPESIGILDGIRVTEDITQWGTESKNQWNLIKWCSNNIALRYFYHDRLFINDPDGLVVRDYDIGDSAVIPYEEARVWATSVAFSGGASLINEFIDKIGNDRKQLYHHILPVLGKAGRPLDFFEAGQPSTLVIDLEDGSKLLAVYNWSDTETVKTIELTDLGLKGPCVLFNGWESRLEGFIADKLTLNMAKHTAQVYRITPVSKKPAIVGADTSVFCGAEVFSSSQSGSSFIITANDKRTQCSSTKVYVYLPMGYTIDGTDLVFSGDEGSIVKLGTMQAGRKSYHIGKK